VATLYLTEPGTVVRKAGETLVVETPDGQERKVPAQHVDLVVAFGGVHITTPVLHSLLLRGVDCVFCSQYGRVHGRLISGESPLGELRLSQAAARLDPARAAGLARDIARGKVANQRAFILRVARRRPLLAPSLQAAAVALESSLSALDRLNPERDGAIDLVRGLEGEASRVYYGALRHLWPAAFGFTGRRKRPPPDPANSLLSFLYTVLTYAVESAVRRVGLDPYIGFLHPPGRSRPALALDLVEEFRPVLADPLALALALRGRVGPDSFRTDPEAPGAVLLRPEAMRAVLAAFEERLAQRVLHPLRREHLTYRQVLDAQAREMAWALRTGRDYRPFRTR